MSATFQGVNEDYEQKYAADAELGKELDPGARIWQVYQDEAAKYDQSMLTSWKEMLDIYLVYAGLFSAVVTTFLVQASQSLQGDYSQINSFLLAELVNYHRIADGMTRIPIQTLHSLEQYSPSSAAIWINGLWFTSLAMSLLSALACVSLKQWISIYAMRSPCGSFDGSLIRQFRFRNLQEWWIPTFIGLLPQLLIASLFLFLAGLVILLFSLHREIAIFITIPTTLAFLAYVVSTLLPIFVLQCPYRTHLTLVLYKWLSIFRRSVPFFEREEVFTDIGTFDGAKNMADALFWLYDNTTDPSANSIIFEAMSAAATHTNHEELSNLLGRHLSDGGNRWTMGNDLMSVFETEIAVKPGAINQLRVERCKKTCRFIMDSSDSRGWPPDFEKQVIEELLCRLEQRCASGGVDQCEGSITNTAAPYLHGPDTQVAYNAGATSVSGARMANQAHNYSSSDRPYGGL